jgi:hypothetical protein
MPLDAAAVLAIHRHKDGLIAITRKAAGKTEQLWMIRPDELEGTLSIFRDWLLDGGHFSTQAYWKAAPWKHKATGLPAIGVDKHRLKGSRRWGRVTENLRWLNCFSVDIDCGRTEADAKSPEQKMTVKEARRRLEDMQEAGIIPRLSMYGYSGRGLYALWLLHDDRHPDQSAPALKHFIPLWKSIQRELVDRVERAQLPADRMGSLITQYYKLPGVVHPVTKQSAEYFITLQGDEQKRLVSYTLGELASLMAIPCAPGAALPCGSIVPEPEHFRRALRPGSCPARREGYKARYRKTAEDMCALHLHRLTDGSGGWKKRDTPYTGGHRSPKYGRRRILALFADCLVRSYYSPRELTDPQVVPQELYDGWLAAIRSMAANCSPPWPDPEDGPRALENVLDSALAVYRPNRYGAQLIPPIPSRKTLCAALGITAELAEDLELNVLHTRPPPTRRTAAEIAAEGEARRELLRAYITENPITSTGERWSYRNIRDRVPGYDVSHETARTDWYILFPKTPRGRRRRIPAIGGFL